MFVCQFEEIKNARVPDHHTIFKWHEFGYFSVISPIYIYASWSNMQKYYYIYPYLHGIGLI